MLRQVASLLVRQPWIKKAAVSTPGVRDLAWRFVAGEDLDAGVATARDLNAAGIKATLNFIGEHVHTEQEAIEAADAARESVRRLRREELEPNVSVKLTNLGLDVSEDLCRRLLDGVLEDARQVGGFIRIDMEASPYVERTLRIFDEVRRSHGDDTVGIVLQSYLRHRRCDLDRLVAAGARVRLVKGGYWEPADVVYRRRADLDAAFLRDIDRLVAHGRQPAIATHDENAIARACRVAAVSARDRRAIEFQMQYGIRPELQSALVRDGYPVRAYVPYGSRWHDYVLGCIRRLPGNALRRLGDRVRGRGTPTEAGAAHESEGGIGARPGTGHERV